MVVIIFVDSSFKDNINKGSFNGKIKLEVYVPSLDHVSKKGTTHVVTLLS